MHLKSILFRQRKPECFLHWERASQGPGLPRLPRTLPDVPVEAPVSLGARSTNSSRRYIDINVLMRALELLANRAK